MITRVRPYLGTVVKIDATGVEQSTLTAAFDEIARLEKIFNFHDYESILAQYNSRQRHLKFSPEFDELLETCTKLIDLSCGYFNPEREGRLDLSGIAKGFIVDKTVNWILARAPSSCGSVNAGGDVRFFGRELGEVTLRLGTEVRAFTRTLKLSRSSVATSAPKAFNSRPRYAMKARGHTAVVQAQTATIADALTKVVLFAPADIAAQCCEVFSAVSFLFGENGELMWWQGAA